MAKTIRIKGYTIPQLRKAIIAWIGFITLLATALVSQFGGFFPTQVTLWIVTGVTFLVAVGVFLTKNALAIDDASDGVIDGKFTEN